jgi:hypothetical protein
LRDAVANLNLPENRHKGRRIGRGQGRAQQQGHDHGRAEDEIRGEPGDSGRDDHTDRRNDDYGDPDLLEDVEAQRGAAIEKNVTGAEQQDDLVQRRIRPDVDQAKRFRADPHPDNQKHRHIGNPDSLRQQASEGANGKDKPAGKQRMLGDLDRG